MVSLNNLLLILTPEGLPNLGGNASEDRNVKDVLTLLRKWRDLADDLNFEEVSSQ